MRDRTINLSAALDRLCEEDRANRDKILDQNLSEIERLGKALSARGLETGNARQ